VIGCAGGGHAPTFRLGRVGVVVDVGSLVRPVVEGAGLELFDVAYDRAGGRRILRVTVDREGGLDVDTLAATSDKIARRLDLEGFGEGRYELEVSSPGIEHPLRTRAHLERAIGDRVNVRTASPVDDARVHTGVLRSVADDEIVVDVDGAERSIPRVTITSARTVADWAAELKGSV
jgi:ribosome maturation factor RimP